MKRKMQITLNGFHGYETHTVLVDVTKDDKHTGDRETDYYSDHMFPYWGEIAESAAGKFACTMSDCMCGEGIDTTFPITAQELESKHVELRGNYAHS